MKRPTCTATIATGERRGEVCGLPGFKPINGKWFCIIHNEARVKRVARLQDLLYGINPEEKNRDNTAD